MMRIPYGNTQLTTLAEDMALLRKTVGYKPLPEEKELLDEAMHKNHKVPSTDDDPDEDEDEKELESEMEHLITLAGEFYDREMERYEE